MKRPDLKEKRKALAKQILGRCHSADIAPPEWVRRLLSGKERPPKQR